MIKENNQILVINQIKNLNFLKIKISKDIIILMIIYIFYLEKILFKNKQIIQYKILNYKIFNNIKMNELNLT